MLSICFNSDLYIQSKKLFEEIPVDKYINYPFFGSGLTYKDKVSSISHYNYKYLLYYIQPDVYIVNKYFGLGVPDYQAVGTKVPQWKVDILNG